jgi:hypothetical protein
VDAERAALNANRQIERFKQGKEWERMEKGRFNTNRAELAVVFSEAQLYVKRQGWHNLSYKQNGLKPYAELRPSLPPLAEEYVERDNAWARQWFDANKGDGNAVLFKDYGGRPVRLTKKSFENHLKEDRASYISFIEGVLIDPDEVFLTPKTQSKKHQISLLKLYDPNPVKVVVQWEKEGARLITWYPLDKKDKQQIDRNERTGILMYKK